MPINNVVNNIVLDKTCFRYVFKRRKLQYTSVYTSPTKWNLNISLEIINKLLRLK